jgi:hypothetical protein
VWLPVVVAGETLLGLRAHPLFTIPAAFAALGLLPVLAEQPMSRTAWRASAGLAFVLAVGFAVAAGFQPAYSAKSPQRIDLIYFENAQGDARWIADTAWKVNGMEPIPGALLKAGNLKVSDDAYPGFGHDSAYAAPTAMRLYPLPSAAILSEEKIGASRSVTLAFRASADADALVLRIPKTARLAAIDLRGQHLVTPDDLSGPTRLVCVSRDCRNLTVTFTFTGDPAAIAFAEERFAFPPSGAFLARARPVNAMPSQSGDQIILAAKVTLR